MKKNFFVGRHEVIDKILSAFHSNNIVILKGEAGVGKSAICKHIMQENLIHGVRTIKWIDYYVDGISVEFPLDESVLYIIDNFDGHYNDESKIMEIGQANKILVNTRDYHFANEFIEIKIDVLSMSEAKQLLSLYNPNIESSIMEKVIEIANYNPAMLELMGTISKNNTEKFLRILSDVNEDYRLDKGEIDVLIRLYINLAKEYLMTNNYGQAEIWFERALEFSENNKKELYKSDIFVGLSLVYSNQRCYEKAMICLEKARELTSSKRDTIAILNEMARIMTIQGRINEAKELLVKCLGQYKDEPVICAMVYNNLGGILKAENPEQALEYYYKALEIKERQLADYPSLAMTYNNIAGILSTQKKYQEAAEYLDRACKILQEKVPKSDERFHIVSQNLLKVQEKLSLRR